jgi:urease accessory protein
MTEKATSYLRAADVEGPAAHRLTLDAQDRHIRRRRVQLNDGTSILVDLEKPVQLADGDCLVLESGALIEIQAAREDLLEVTAASPAALVKLAWHIGNRHLEAQIEESRILIRPDHVIAHMLEHQGALVREVREGFSPENGAYAHEIGHEHSHSLTETRVSRHHHGEPHGHQHHHHEDDGDDD